MLAASRRAQRVRRYEVQRGFFDLLARVEVWTRGRRPVELGFPAAPPSGPTRGGRQYGASPHGPAASVGATLGERASEGGGGSSNPSSPQASRPQAGGDGGGGGSSRSVEEGGGSGAGEGLAGGVKNSASIIEYDEGVIEKYSLARAMRALDTLITYIGEEERSGAQPGGRHDFKRLMFRRYERRPPGWYRLVSREAVVLIVDTSGSMVDVSELLNYIVAAALRRGDVEVYLAPNGVIEYKLDGTGDMVEVDGEKVLRGLRGRSIIYIGDYDGADTPFILSCQGNRVVWLAPEHRYLDPDDHDWFTVDREKCDFRGVFLRINDLNDVEAYLTLLAMPGPAWIDPYPPETSEDDDW